MGRVDGEVEGGVETGTSQGAIVDDVPDVHDEETMLAADEVDDRRLQTRRQNDQPPPAAVGKSIGMILGILSLVGLIFTAGYNWRSVSNIEAAQAVFREEFVRKDVQQVQLQVLTFQLAEIGKQLEEVRVELRAQRRKGVE